MKRLKRIMALVIAMAMVLTMMSISAFAGETPTTPGTGEGGETTTPTGHTISVDAADTHTYDVYQILVGELSEGTLSNVAWGSSANAQTEGKINGKTATEFAKSMESLSGVDAVAEVAKYFTEKTGSVGQVKAGTPLTGLAEGYYVMVDVTDPLKHDNSTDTKALNVIRLVDDVTVEKKWSTTTDTKTIVADTLGKDTGENAINPGKDNNNVSVGDTVKFNIAATVPENADKFKEGTFFFVITDKLSTGLTMVENNGAPAIEVYEGDTLLTADKYTIKYPGTNGNTFEIGLKNAATYKNKTINVKYSAVLNENAVIGDAGNPNTSTVKFSNDPNKTYDGTPEDSNNPGFPDSTKQVPTGETPESQTKTYSTGIKILKVDENGDPLKQDVTFELSGTSAKKVVTKTETFTVDDENGTYYKLKNGTYTKTAPTTTNTMIDAEPGATKGYVEDAEASGTGVIVIDGKNYRPYVPATDSGKHIYVLQEGSADAYADNHKYVKTVTQKTVDSDATDHKMSESVDENGIVRFDGLGAGDYTIKETQTPAGYNTVSDVTLHITYNENGEAKFTAEGASYEDGVLKIKVINHKGSTLPSTGGIGTTIFYVIGTVLVLGAGVVLITRRRMDA